MKPTTPLLAICLLLLGTACHDAPAIDLAHQAEPDPLKENLINANRYMVRGEEQQIESYLQRRGWQATKLPGGTRLVVQSKGAGNPLQYNEEVNIRYTLYTLTDNIIYNQQTEAVTVGKMKPTAGLDTALLHLRHGAKAWVIAPSEQAYGVVGDADRVGARMTLVYQLEIE